MMVAELQFLRGQVAEFKKQLGRPASAPGESASVPKPEVRVDLKAIAQQREALLGLVVAVENFFGPEKGVEKPKMSPELRGAMEASTKLVKREKKP